MLAAVLMGPDGVVLVEDRPAKQGKYAARLGAYGWEVGPSDGPGWSVARLVPNDGAHQQRQTRWVNVASLQRGD
jgi:hypothetical protein